MDSAEGPISPDPITRWRPGDLPAYLSNGLIGLRISHIPFLGGVAMVSGFEGLDASSGVEAFARSPFPLAADVCVNGVALSAAPDHARLLRQEYDFATGELHSSFVFRPRHDEVRLDVTSLCSRSHPTIVLQEIRLTAESSCEVALAAGIDPAGVEGEWAGRRVDDPGLAKADGCLLWRSHGGLGTCGAAYATEFDGTEDVRTEHELSRIAPLRTTYTFHATRGREYRLREITSLVPDLLHQQPEVQAARLVQAAQLRGTDTLRRLNADSWKDLWRSRIVLEGAPKRWQAMADAAFYYLHSSVHPSSNASTSIFGLANWPDYHYYRGHVMWDIEVFAVPPLLLTYPEAAAALLRYRSTRLKAARHNAWMSGYRGVQFPWESSIKQGQEAGPGIGTAPALEHHVSPDVAIAFARYVHATGDMRFASEHAWPVVSGVADFVSSRVEPTGRGYELRRVTGIAETATPRHNNAFTNIAAIVALREAISLGERLDIRVPRDWPEVADGLVIPMDGNVIANHDGYQSDQEKAETPEAAAALFPLDYDPGPQIAEATFKFYLGLAGKYAGAPMLSAMLGVYAARLGDRDLALEMFERGYADFVVDPFRLTLEYAPRAHPDQTRAGPFTANLGGFLTSCLYGLTGVALGPQKPGDWPRRKAVLPRGWDAIRVDRIWTREEPASLTAQHGRLAVIESQDGERDGGEHRRSQS